MQGIYAENNLQNFLCNFSVLAMQTCELPPATLLPATLPPATLLPATLLPAPLPPATRPGTGPSRLLARWGRLVALAVGAFLLPWCAVLGATLPVTTRAPNWSLAWMGLDLAEAVAALAAAVLLSRGSPRAGLAAVAGAALLFADAWFDVCTSPPGLERAWPLARRSWSSCR